MNNESIVGALVGASFAVLLVQLALRGKTDKSTRALPYTTPTNGAIHGATPASKADRLQRLVASGALTGEEYALLQESPAETSPQSGRLYRLSILQNGPNKIRDIKALREAFHLGLRDAKDIVDHLPQTFNTPMELDKAISIAEHLHTTGMTTAIT